MQDELTKSEAQDDKRLVLGFDAGCFTCSDLAARIEERVGDRLAVRNLNDPEVQAWRKEALGEDAKWAPTLFEIEDGRVKAWAGWRMGWALSRAIGPAATWQVMQALGEVGAAPKIEESALVERLPGKAAGAVVSISRGQFLKGVGGAAVAMSVLSGTGALASPALAATREPRPYDVVKSRRVTGAQLAALARRVAGTADVRNLAGTSLSTVAKIRAADPSAFVLTLRNGIVVLAVSYHLPNGRTLFKYASDKPLNKPLARGTKSIAKLYRVEGKRHVLIKASEAGRLWRADSSKSRTQNEGIVPLAECPPIGGSTGGAAGCCLVLECVDFEPWDCGFGGIAAGSACYGIVTAVGALAAPVSGGMSLGGAAAVAGGCSSAAYFGIKECCADWRWVQRPCPTSPTNPQW
ncbi:MAG: hypothetical protein AVDCRST_MAG02-1032 [uncultured Rubrobacteraceae bacterium]|uniref:Uncharacterized protein n=1 Tax=uncultured Rubrobacteraceae bacterium TaxID=349277 RepID=A0A6J4QPJ4_9ACTN|nr:MAG: hypothetical protein AVDCRST_MAG02-1032 [uncultured Rubrobacteraceae bacterium]